MILNKKNKYTRFYKTAGFTLAELMVTVGIFTVMAGAVLASYDTYTSNAIFANASEDVVLALRQAQVYGAGAKGSSATCGGSSIFDCSYGVFFSTVAPYQNKLTVFADTDNNHVYTSASDTVVSEASVTWSSSVSVTELLCGGINCTNNVASITFKRPTPDAYIADIEPYDPLLSSPYNVFSVTIADVSLGKTSKVVVSRTGQISLE